MTRLQAHEQALYELRFSPMCKPAGEVANLTQLESHTVKARTMIFWRIAAGLLDWGPREVELLYQSTLDTISQAFDVFDHPIGRYMLDARADVWDAGLAPAHIVAVVEASQRPVADPPTDETIVVAGEIAQLGGKSDVHTHLVETMVGALNQVGVSALVWVTPAGAVAYTLGAQDVARAQAQAIADGLAASGASTIIADGPETAWMLTKIYPELGLSLPTGTEVRLLSSVLADAITPPSRSLGRVFVHDSRAAYLLADTTVNHRAIMPGYHGDEADFGDGEVYTAPRKLVDIMGAERVWGQWTRGLAKTSGADDALWLTYPALAKGLAQQRLDYAKSLGAEIIVTDSPLAAAWLRRFAEDIPVWWLPELIQ